MAKADLSVHLNQVPRMGTCGGLRVREDVLFTDRKGEDDKGTRRRAEEALQKVGAPLQRMLQADEVVLYVSRVQAPISVFEQLAFGWYVYRMTGTTLVATNQRLIHFNTDASGNWKRNVRTIAWGDLAEAKASASLLNGKLTVKPQGGKKLVYWRVRRSDAQKFKLLFETLTTAAAGQRSGASEMTALCPECFSGLQTGVYQCQRCGLVFKDERTMVRRSLIIPGGGYFYCGHTFFGIGDFVGESMILLYLLVTLWLALGGGTAEDRGEASSGGLLLVLAFLGVILAIEKWGTIHHCRRFIREFIPTDAKREMQSMGAGVGRIG